MDNLKGLLGIRRIDRIPNSKVKEICDLKKAVDKRTEESALRWFKDNEIVVNSRTVKSYSEGSV